MFTGLIEETGLVKTITALPGGKVFVIQCDKILDDLKVDDSIAVNGVCLTATGVVTGGFEATAVKETLVKSTLNRLKKGDVVNLERALLVSDRLGGHIVQGHVDSTGIIRSISKESTGYTLTLELDRNLLKYAVQKGSITVNGISLTIARIYSNKIEIAVIPHTWQNTNLLHVKQGSAVNIEVDLVAKYVENLIAAK